MNKLFLAFIFCFFSAHLSAQIYINELSAANISGILDGDGDREDWVELYNSGPTPVNISGWFLSDNPNNPQKWVVPAGQTIAANSYRIVFCSGKNKVAPPYLHTNFKITQTKNESVILTNASGVTVDSYTISTPNQGDHSYGRSPNAGPNWKIYTTPTPGFPNTGSSYLSYAPDVTASLDAGFYPGNVTVSLSTSPGFTIRYTTDGTEPTTASTLYPAPVNIAVTTVLKARAFSANAQILPGFVTANTYFINVSHTIPVISIAGDNVVNLLNGSSSGPIGSFEYFENGVLKEEAYGQFNKHGNDSWNYAQRGIDWITRDQLGYTDVLKQKFFSERTRNKFQRIILKAAANDNYPAEIKGGHIRDAYVQTLAIRGGLNVDARTSLSCILYANAQYWGVYEMREKVDDADFTSYYYDQDDLDIDYIKTWGNTWAEYGTTTDWYTLKAFILGNNMAVPANYAYVQQQFDLLSLIDYIIINQHTVCKDWLNWNTSWWRGRNPAGGAKRWRYTLWDMDATFGHYINYTGIPNIGPTADPCDVEHISNNGDPENHIDILMALFANPDFKAMYINRYADLLNTSLSCNYMNALLDTMTNIIEPEMAKQCARWGGTVGQWNQNVQAIHNFINIHCQLIDQSIVDCYNVTGPYTLTVNISPAASPNQVMVNTITPPNYPFTGDYFGGVNINLIAKAATGWQFDHWEVNGNTFGPDQYAAAILLAFQTNGVATAFFIPTGPCPAPTSLAFTETTPASLNWTGQPIAGSYAIKYRKTGDLTWMTTTTNQTFWNVDSLPGCSNFEVQIQSVCPQGNSAAVDFSLNTPNYLTGFGVADVHICNTGTAMLDATFAGAAYSWDDGSSNAVRSVSDAGAYWVTVQLKGCTTTDTAMVSKTNATANLQPEVCPGGSFMAGGTMFDAQHPAGQVILPGMATGACDSIINVSLKFLTPSQMDIQRQSCNPAEVGTDTVMMSNHLGCDSLVITTTTFNAAAVAITALLIKNCDPATVGVDTVYFNTVTGCDSLVITTTTLAPKSQTLLSASSCNPNLIGTDTLILSNYLGCDSLVITTTSFNPAAIPVTALFVKNCDPAAVGVDTVHFNSVTGCDSLVITTTTLAPKSQTLLSASSCNTNLIGTDTLILSNHLGCDSLVITTTSFNPAAIPVTAMFVKNCDPAAVGVDTVHFNSVNGCDSLVITTTTLAPKSQTLLSATSCNPNLIGKDTLVLSNYLGCDSLVITTTSFNPATIPVTSLFVKNCDPAAIGVDTVHFNSVNGCDSLVVTTTTLAPISKTLLSATSCNPGLVGTDTLILSNYLGCDSMVITTTTFDPAAITLTALFVKNCDPAAIGVDTVHFNSVTGCDSLVVTTTTLAPISKTLLSATSCNPNLIGTDTLVLSNYWGCDSLVITTTTFSGMEMAAFAKDILCFGDKNGLITLDTILTAFLPVVVELGGRPVQMYTGAPLIWENLSAGAYSLLATNAASCTLSQPVEIADASPLLLDLPQHQLMLHLGDSVWVEPTAGFQIAGAEWSPSTGVRCPDCPSTFIAAPQSAIYTLTVADPNGCSTSTLLTVQVDKGVRVFVPNAIAAPGTGGPNDQLTVFAGPEVDHINFLQIFDRWGNKIFEQTDPAPNIPSAWDGTFRGKPIDQGVFIWMCEVVTVDGRKVTLSGDITVVR